MANKGLKKYTKQLTQNINNLAQVNVNANKEDANIIIAIPLIKTIGKNPIELSIIYNHQNRNGTFDFGKGYKMNFYKSLLDYENEISIINADGSTDDYFYDDEYHCYYNEETKNKIHRSIELVNGDSDIITYKIVDKFGNTFEYNDGYAEYPDRICLFNGEALSISSSKITKNKDEIVFEKTDSVITKVVYLKNEKELFKANLSYDTNKVLSNVKYFEGTRQIDELDLSIHDDEIKLKDNFRNYGIKYNLQENRVVSVYDGYNESYTNKVFELSYEEKHTIIKNIYDKKMHLYFRNDGALISEMDDKQNIISYNIDENNKTLKYQSKSSNFSKINEYNLLKKPVTSFAKSGNLTIVKKDTNEHLKDMGYTNMYSICGNGEASYVIDSKGLSTDKITLFFFAKHNVADINFKVKIITSANEEKELHIEKSELNKWFEFYALELDTQKSYTFIKIMLESQGDYNLDISDIILIKGIFGGFYQYDSQNNIIDSLTGNSEKNHTYSSNSFITFSFDSDGNYNSYEYDVKGNMIKTSSSYDSFIDCYYDENQNITSSLVSNYRGNKILCQEMTYDANDNITSKKDEFNNQSTYSYDEFSKLKDFTNALGVLTKYTYNDDNSICLMEVLKNQDKTSISYEYNIDKTLKKVTLDNGTVYDFGYDSNKNLTTIKANGKLLYNLAYNKNRLISQKYGDSCDAFTFSYQDSLLSQINYEKNGTTTPRFKLYYDFKNRLSSVENVTLNKTITYSYDLNDNLIEVKDDTNSIQYDYDNKGNVIKEKRNIEDKTIIETFDSLSRSKSSHPDSIFDGLQEETDYVACFFKDGTKLRGKDKSIEMYNNKWGHNQTYSRKGIIPGAEVSEFNALAFKLTGANLSKSGTIAFWINPTRILENDCLFSTSYKTTGYGHIKVVATADLKLSVKIRDVVGDEYTILTTTNVIRMNQWNFFSLTWNDKELKLMLNDLTRFESTVHNFEIDSEPIYNLCHYHAGNGFVFNYIQGFITAVLAGSFSDLPQNRIREFYMKTKEYLIDNLLEENGCETVNTSAANYLDIPEDLREMFSIYPLNNSVVSLDNDTPKLFDLRSTSNIDKDRTFNFNNDIKKYAYVSDGNKLVYDFGIKNEATIAMRACVFLREDRQYLFQHFDLINQVIGMYIAKDGCIYIEFADNIYNTNLYVSLYDWHFFSFSFSKTIASDSIPNDEFSVRVLLDSKEYETIISTNKDYGALQTMIGRAANDLMNNNSYLANEIKTYALYGQIEMLCVRKAYCEKETLNRLKDTLDVYTITHQYDELDMLQKKDIHKNDISILSHTYEYQKNNNYLREIITKESIKGKDFISNREYTVDAIGNVTSINDSIFGSHSYEYNYKGFLTKDDDIIYKYDSNGNITQADETVLQYDSTYKDQLINVNGTDILYDTNVTGMPTTNPSNPLNPKKYGNITYNYEGRRLTGYIKNDGLTSIGINFTYNEEGLRLQKNYKKTNLKNFSSINKQTKYYYNGTNLISEINNTYRLDYLYDEYNLLYGFIYNSEKYFYVRDCLQNILGIVDQEGKLVVQYSYTAYGKIKSITGTKASTIGEYNPFRYKGYYYDSETEMYYCKSRYYVPQWCRWLNGDAASYISPYNINGVNLFSYCGNNPITMIDESGHFAISTLIWIIVGIAAVATTATITYGAITDTPVVLDASFSIGMGAGFGAKVGISFVIDFKNSSFGFYPHAGSFAGVKWNTIGGSYSIGLISNYTNEGDYRGPFADMGGGYLIGIDHCFDPTKDYERATRASSLTFGNNKGLYYGNDYYWYWGSIAFPWRKK